MPLITRIVAIGTASIALAGITAGEAGASPGGVIYNGGAFTATAPGKHTFTIGGTYKAECSSPSATGSGGFPGVSLTMSFAGCTFHGFPATVTTSGPWNFPIITSLGGGRYANGLSWPTGTTTTISAPITGCSVVFSGAQYFSSGVGGSVMISENQTGGVTMTNNVNGLVFTASSCPFSSGTTGQYTGTFFLPGVAIY